MGFGRVLKAAETLTGTSEEKSSSGAEAAKASADRFRERRRAAERRVRDIVIASGQRTSCGREAGLGLRFRRKLRCSWTSYKRLRKLPDRPRPGARCYMSRGSEELADLEGDMQRGSKDGGTSCGFTYGGCMYDGCHKARKSSSAAFSICRRSLTSPCDGDGMTSFRESGFGGKGRSLR